MRALCAHLSLIGLCYFIRTCSEEDECNWQNKWQDPDNGCLSVHFCTLISAGEDIQTQSNDKNSCLTCGYKEKDECNGIIIRIIRRIYDRMFSASNINGHEVFLLFFMGEGVKVLLCSSGSPATCNPLASTGDYRSLRA